MREDDPHCSVALQLHFFSLLLLQLVNAIFIILSPVKLPVKANDTRIVTRLLAQKDLVLYDILGF